MESTKDLYSAFAHINFDPCASPSECTAVLEDPAQKQIVQRAMRVLIDLSKIVCTLPVVVLGPDDLGGDMDLARRVRRVLITFNLPLASRLFVGKCSLIFRCRGTCE